MNKTTKQLKNNHREKHKVTKRKIHQKQTTYKSTDKKQKKKNQRGKKRKQESVRGCEVAEYCTLSGRENR